MAVTRWSFRNYNAFLREAKQTYALSHYQAQGFYRQMRADLNHSVRAVDIKRNPILASREAKIAVNLPEKRPIYERVPVGAMPEYGVSGGIPVGAVGGRTDTIQQWLQSFDQYDWDDADYDYWEGSGSYGED